MWEFRCFNWSAMRGVWGEPAMAPNFLEQVVTSTADGELARALDWLESYASDLGVPSEATSAVVSCLVGAAQVRSGVARLAIVETIEELSCGRGVDEYSSKQHKWLVATIGELSSGMHLWMHMGEHSSAREATLALQLLAYCAAYLPDLAARVWRYFELCEVARPELRDDIAAIRSQAAKLTRLSE